VADIKSEYLAGLKSESVAGFELECMADFIGIRTWITNGPPALVHQSGSTMIRRPSNVALGDEVPEQQQAFQSAYTTALEWGSYLAKEFSKGNTPFRMREYDSSRL
jgi:hypothetical protein